MDMVLSNGHLDDVDLQILAGLPNNPLAGDGDPARQNFGAELRG